jgi:hypothetical protein
MDDDVSRDSKERILKQMLHSRTNYALNDFDDNYSVSDAGFSMVSGSINNMRLGSGVPFIEASHMTLMSTSKVMLEMAGDTANDTMRADKRVLSRRNSNVSRRSEDLPPMSGARTILEKSQNHSF